eukprot:1344664-Rhodomonas_salina.1
MILLATTTGLVLALPVLALPVLVLDLWYRTARSTRVARYRTARSTLGMRTGEKARDDADEDEVEAVEPGAVRGAAPLRVQPPPPLRQCDLHHRPVLA